MNYSKPDITPLGSASAAVRGVGKTAQPNADSQAMHRFTVPAYEADE
jgi:hypothetical protein